MAGRRPPLPAEGADRLARVQNLILSLWMQSASGSHSPSSVDFAAQDAIAKALDQELTLELPVTGVGPSSSPWLEEDLIEPLSTKSSLADGSLVLWTAPGIILEPSEAADLLLALTTSDPTETLTEQTGIAAAFDLRFAARSAEMVLELITRGRLLPSLELTDDGWCAHWRPLVDAHDRGRIEALVWALPSSFMAAVRTGAGRERKSVLVDEQTPDQILRSFMWSVTDSLARRFVADRASPVPSSAKTKRQARFNATDAWLRALSSPEGTVDADEDEDGLQGLSDSLAAWNATVNTESEPVRICFRIVPPAEDEPEEIPVPSATKRSTARRKIPDDWRIEFALQAVDDPSLLVSAETVWEDGPELTALERHAKHPDEHLLRGLGRAARLVPSIGSALTTAMPVAQSTDAAGALDFLRDQRADSGTGGVRSAGSTMVAIVQKEGRTPSQGPHTVAEPDIEHGVHRARRIVRRRVGGSARRRQDRACRAPPARRASSNLSSGSGANGSSYAKVTSQPPSPPSTRRRTPPTTCRPEKWSEPLSASNRFQAICPSWPLRLTDGSGDLLAGAEDRGCRPGPPRTDSWESCGPTRRGGSDGSRSSADLGLGACLADDMGLGKTAQLLALVFRRDASQFEWVRRSSYARCLSSATGSGRRRASPRSCRCYVHHGQNRLDGKAFTRNARKDGPGALDLRSRGARPGAARHRQVEPSRPRRGAADQEQCGPDDPERPGDPGGSAHRHDRHPGREPPERAVVDHAVPEPRLARFREGISRALRHPHRTRR